jgi:hypothetical protein
MLIRRMRISEARELQKLCDRDHRWSRYFQSHSKWVKRAIDDFTGAGRVVFGAFRPGQVEGDEITHELIGCIFLTKSLYGPTIEIKNWVIPGETPVLDQAASDIAHRLLDKAIRFCETRGDFTIEIAIPQPEHELIALLISHNFRVVSLRDRYLSGTDVCVLERQVGEAYCADPFDIRGIAHWLLTSFLNCEQIEVHDDGGDFFRLEFRLRSPGGVFSPSNASADSMRVTGTLWVVSDPDVSDEVILGTICARNSLNHLILLLHPRLSTTLRTELKHRGVIGFDRPSLISLCEPRPTSLSIPIESADVGGVLTVLEKSEIERYLHDKTLTYYLISGLHHGLIPPAVGEAAMLAIYCPNWAENKPGVIGFYDITYLRRLPFATLLEEELPNDAALSKDELRHYATFREDELIAELKCESFRRIDIPLRIRGGGWPSLPQISEYLFTEIEERAANAAYLDWTTCDNLRDNARDASEEQIPETTPQLFTTAVRKWPENGVFDAVISYSRAHEPFVAAFAKELEDCIGFGKVFIDKWFQGATSGVNANVRFRDVVRHSLKVIIVFISKEYLGSDWCMNEWRAVGDVIFHRMEDKVMLFRFDGTAMPDLPAGALAHEVESRTPSEIIGLVQQRLDL